MMKTSTQAADLRVGDDVLPMTGGRMTIASVEVVGTGAGDRVRITSTLGRVLTVSPIQGFVRYSH